MYPRPLRAQRKSRSLWLQPAWGFNGESGIRTHGTHKGTRHFQCRPIGHSGISPAVFKRAGIVARGLGFGKAALVESLLGLSRKAQSKCIFENP
jgi:hypothetical protein